MVKRETQQTGECCWAWPYLPSPPLRMVTGEDTHGDHGCQMLFPMMPKNDWFHGSGRCFLTARGGDSATPGRRDTGRMWNVTEQGHSKGHCKTCHPSPPVIEEFTARSLVLHMKNIASEFILCLETDLGFVCLRMKWWWIKRGRRARQNSMDTFSINECFCSNPWIVWCR